MSILVSINSALVLVQVKFSELTLDMYRMLLTLEREPDDSLSTSELHFGATLVRSHSIFIL